MSIGLRVQPDPNTHLSGAIPTPKPICPSHTTAISVEHSRLDGESIKNQHPIINKNADPHLTFAHGPNTIALAFHWRAPQPPRSPRFPSHIVVWYAFKYSNSTSETRTVVPARLGRFIVILFFRRPMAEFLEPDENRVRYATRCHFHFRTRAENDAAKWPTLLMITFRCIKPIRKLHHNP